MPGADPQQIRVDRIGKEGEPVVVVERFLPQPDQLVAEAASIPFKVMGEFYPGVRARAPRLYLEELAPMLVPIVREVFGNRERSASHISTA